MNLDELESLAKAAKQLTPEFGVVLEARSLNNLMVAVDRLHYAANPETILALISLLREMADALHLSSNYANPYYREVDEVLTKYKEMTK